MATILIIEDRAINREFLSTLLGYTNHIVVEANNGMEGLQMAQTRHFDLIITDISMPIMDGYKLVEELRANPSTAKIPVIFYTATYRMEEIYSKAEEYGIKHIIAKPCEPEDIFNTINTALGLYDHAPTDFSTKGNNSTYQLLEEKIARLEPTISRLTTLTELSLDMSSVRESLYLFHLACCGGGKLLRACYAAIALLEDNGKILRNFLIYDISSQKLISSPPNVETGILDKAIFSQCFTSSDNLRIHPKELGLSDDCAPISSFLGVPVATPAQRYGLLYFVNKTGTEAFDKYDERIAITLADKLAINYENIVLYQVLDYNAKLLEQEIESRMQIEATLRQSEQNFRQLAESIQEVFWIAAPNMSQIFYVSPHYEKIWGRSVEELYKNPCEWLEAIVADDRKILVENLANFQKNQKLALRCRIIHASGLMLWIHVRIFPVYDEIGRLYHIAGIAEDITEQKQLEEFTSQRKHHLELVELEHINSMNEVTSTLIREINQPLASITTHARSCIKKLQVRKCSKAELLATMKLVTQQTKCAGTIIQSMKNSIQKNICA